jgi:FSR family fosmidomycin resistance protein-like MFS transporter
MAKFNLKILLLLSVGHLTTDIYQGALPSILPFLKDELSLSYTMTGFIMIMSNLTSSVLQPVFGYFSDRKEKPILLPLGVFGAGVGLSLLSLPSNYTAVLVLVTISGLGVASYHPEGYKTARFFAGDRLATTGMSFFAVGGNLGFAIGPVLAMFTVKYFGFSGLPLIMIPSLAVAGAILLLKNTLALPELPHHFKKDTAYRTPKGSYRSLSLIIGVVIMRSWTQMGLMAYIPFYYINYLKGDAIYAAKLVSVLLFGGAVGTLAGAPIADRWGHRRFLRVSMFIAALVFPLVLITTGSMLFVSLFVLGMILVSTFSVTVVMAQNLLPKNLGIASGLMVGFAIGTGGIGVTVLGVIADAFGVPFALRSITVLPVLGFLLSMVLQYPIRQEEE